MHAAPHAFIVETAYRLLPPSIQSVIAKIITIKPTGLGSNAFPGDGTTTEKLWFFATLADRAKGIERALGVRGSGNNRGGATLATTHLAGLMLNAATGKLNIPEEGLSRDNLISTVNRIHTMLKQPVTKQDLSTLLAQYFHLVTDASGLHHWYSRRKQLPSKLIDSRGESRTPTLFHGMTKSLHEIFDRAGLLCPTENANQEAIDCMVNKLFSNQSAFKQAVTTRLTTLQTDATFLTNLKTLVKGKHDQYRDIIWPIPFDNNATTTLSPGQLKSIQKFIGSSMVDATALLTHGLIETFKVQHCLDYSLNTSRLPLTNLTAILERCSVPPLSSTSSNSTYLLPSRISQLPITCPGPRLVGYWGPSQGVADLMFCPEANSTALDKVLTALPTQSAMHHTTTPPNLTAAPGQAVSASPSLWSSLCHTGITSFANGFIYGGLKQEQYTGLSTSQAKLISSTITSALYVTLCQDHASVIPTLVLIGIMSFRPMLKSFHAQRQLEPLLQLTQWMIQYAPLFAMAAGVMANPLATIPMILTGIALSHATCKLGEHCSETVQEYCGYSPTQA